MKNVKDLQITKERNQKTLGDGRTALAHGAAELIL
jgi:hypothetical protein